MLTKAMRKRAATAGELLRQARQVHQAGDLAQAEQLRDQAEAIYQALEAALLGQVQAQPAGSFFEMQPSNTNKHGE